MRGHLFSLSRQCRRLATIIMLLCLGMAAHAPASAAGFDGITVIELNDPLASQALGASRNSAFLVTFVSGLGSYAAVMSRSERSCVAWQREGSYKGDSITFGLAFDPTAPRVRNPSLCYPFELILEEGGEVRIVAENQVPDSMVPGASTSLARYNRRREVLMRVPLQAIDWALPIFSLHSIREARLGPVLDDAPVEYLVGPLRSSTRGTHKNVSARIGTQPRNNAPETLNGYAMAAEHTGWPWDAIYAMWFAARLNPPNVISAFDDSITQRYGAPTLVDERNKWYWLYDLNGEPAQQGPHQPGACLGSMALWNRGSIATHNSDIGPWACQLVMTLDRGGVHDVTTYRVEVTNGYAMAINHFLARLAEVAELKERLRVVEGATPVL
ncbi:hypothetical protein [Halomonas urumqiensis]|uniref:Uncharacterized protein n=1 Tax=Halomonas urumqiensis TaxID=1684789 RepID=A0A2N7UPX9_9GAMM|nr:hypothetical protein [Halomonas urumqiensis]PMR82504.1 hypothetical protein C1H70_01940 [Halomonas urumqiensis]PTB04015.1 hypothetical protein C6V82_06060 [Halomonas urumqiensis]GHE19723.1 hypothetical protein GCM10017767_02440 [Halomonas urumqiensis]